MKFQKLINMLQKQTGNEEKIKQQEEKRDLELEEVVAESAKKKREGLAAIKERFNELALKVKVDATAVQKALKR